MPAQISSGSAPAGRQVGRGSGVYLAAEPSGSAPRRVVVDGKRLSRFMDFIYLDRPCEKLDWKKIQVLNEVRRPPLEQDEIGAVNMRVRRALGRAVTAKSPAHVLEWGCGYHPMRELMNAGGYVGVDIDPSVVAQNRKDFPAEPWYQADGELTHIADESQDAIVSSFVFHFRLTRHHMLTMRRILKPTGFILGNVYRRSPRSRQELALRFERVGLRVRRRKDEAELCTDHEFWCLVPDGHPHPEMATGVLDEVASIVGSSGDRASSSYPAAGRGPES